MKRNCAFMLLVVLAATGGRAAQALSPAPPVDMAAVQAAERAREAVIHRVMGTVVAVYGLERTGAGSGVIIDPAGYALTNHHVVAEAGTEGWGGLADGKLYHWHFVGTDPGGDVALIKIDADHPLPAAPLGNADDLHVGDWVMAMGNPFALSEDQKPTVTLGIVSGLHRYQAGAGANTLVYGDCIQVDASINPGNSGGPLFNMAGQLMGINGRGSFEERGRVNVGVGYAVSIEQIKNFLPDLMATKICQHGTLNATFEDRSAGCVCAALDLDSPIAALGLTLGDRLVRFDGQPIRTQNQYLRVLSTLPAHWPVSVVFDHDGVQHEVWTRLTPLPYGQPRRAPAKPQPAPPVPPDHAQPAKAAIPMAAPGKVRDVAMNGRHVARLLEQWNDFRGLRRASSSRGAAALAQVKPLRLRQTVIVNGKPVGTQTVLWSPDGHAKIEHADKSALDALLNAVMSTLTKAAHPDTAAPTPPSNALPTVLPHSDDLARVLLGSLSPASFAAATLEGGDEADGVRCYRVHVQLSGGRQLVLWFSELARDGRHFQTRLVKMAAADAPGHAGALAYTFGAYRPEAGLLLPTRINLVRGLAETPLVELRTTEVQPAEPPEPGRVGPARHAGLTESGSDGGAVAPADLAAIHQGNIFADAIAFAQQRTVKIYGAGIGREHGYASGIIVSPHGLIVTAQGVYTAGPRLEVELPDGTKHAAKVLRISERLQLALLKVDAATPHYFDLPGLPGAHTAVQPGDWLIAVGNTFNVASGAGEPLSVNLGVMSLRAALDARNRAQDVPYAGDLLLMDAITSDPGEPGGAVVTVDGRLAGLVGRIITSRSTSTRLNYAVPTDHIRMFLDGREPADVRPAPPTVASDATGTPADLGLRLFTLGGHSAPAYVDDVVPGGPADKAGLHKDDLILAVNGQVVRTVRDCTEQLQALPANQPVHLLVKRKHDVLRLELTPVAGKGGHHE